MLGQDTSVRQFDTHQAYLLDMLEYYTPDPKNRRSVIKGQKNGQCSYIPTETSEGCGIGRNLPFETARVYARENYSIDFMFHQKEENSKFIPLEGYKDYMPPEWMQKLGISFLIEVQNLHDQGCYWESVGLSELGKNNVSRIIESYNIDKEQFKKYL